MSNGSGASPRPKLASRWLNCESSPGSLAADAASDCSSWFALLPALTSSCGTGVGCSDSLGIRRQLPKEVRFDLGNAVSFKYGAANSAGCRSAEVPLIIDRKRNILFDLRRMNKFLPAVDSSRGVAGKPHRPRLDCHNLHGVKCRGITASKVWRLPRDSSLLEPQKTGNLLWGKQL